MYRADIRRILNRNILLRITFFYSIYFFSSSINAQLVAFPGAEGYGRFTTGGRGGTVFFVDRLDDDNNPGSLRYAINQTGSRTIVFRVSGTIALKDYLKISKGNVTIAGQTAPGDGICLSNYTLSVQANNVIVRFIRSRLGDTTIVRNSNGSPKLNSKGLPQHVEDDAAHGMGTYRNIIIDHCSFSWSLDEAASFYDNIDFTMQWCLVSESLFRSYHIKGDHGYGGMWGGQGATFHHNLLAHHTSRNPRFNGSRYSGKPAEELVDFVNNVIYNWGFNSAYGGEAGNQNIRANYYKPGPATLSSVIGRIVEPYDNASNWYITDNYVEGSPTVSTDNWTEGVQGSYANYQKNKKALVPFLIAPVVTQTPQEAYNSVLNYVGVNYPKRDALDLRVIEETRTGTVTYGAKSYAKSRGLDTTKVYGIIDSQTDVGGWPILNSLPAPTDTDDDGIPDVWELANGLDPNNVADRNNLNSDGYTMLEVYLNSLVSNSIPVSVADNRTTILTEFKLFANYPNPFNPSTTIHYSLPYDGFVDIKIFNTQGQLIRQLYSGENRAGNHQVVWDGKNQIRNTVVSSIYLCTIRFSNQVKTIKMLLLK